MMEVEAMSDREVETELIALNGVMREPEFHRLEVALRVKAGCLGWTGDPWRQPPRVVLASARAVLSEREAL